MEAIRTRDREILDAHLGGEPYKSIGEQHRITGEAARLAALREGRRAIDKVELDLLAATKTDELPTFLLPSRSGPEFDLALAYVRWVVNELEQRKVTVTVHYRVFDHGAAVFLEGDFSTEGEHR